MKKIEFKGQKLTNSQKKKDISGQKKQAGAELKKKKKDFLGQKFGKKLTNLKKEKKRTFRAKKTSWG